MLAFPLFIIIHQRHRQGSQISWQLGVMRYVEKKEIHIPMVPMMIRLYTVPSTMRSRNSPTDILTRLIPETRNRPRTNPILMISDMFCMYIGSALCLPTPFSTSINMHTITATLNDCVNCQTTSSNIVLAWESPNAQSSLDQNIGLGRTPQQPPKLTCATTMI